MIEFIKYIWQLPQHIVAIIYYIYLACSNALLTEAKSDNVIVYTKATSGSVTLGQYIFVSPKATRYTIMHEWGHTRQSLMLGPLYLVIIGIPSIIWAAIHKYVAPNKSYYWFYTEADANRLGGINLE